MEWNTNQSRLPYHLFTHRAELRRRRRREGVLKATKIFITDLLVMNNIESNFKCEQQEPVQIAIVQDVPMLLENSAEEGGDKIYANLDCKSNENIDYGKTNFDAGVSSANTNWDLDDMLKGNKNEQRTKAGYNFSSSAKNNEPMGMNCDLIDEICNNFKINFDDALHEDNSETNACLNLEEF